MKSAFEQGEIMQIWKSTIEMEKWFDPAFQEFIDKELIPMGKKFYQKTSRLSDALNHLSLLIEIQA